jgi:superfamily II DNA or RNA helicase
VDRVGPAAGGAAVEAGIGHAADRRSDTTASRLTATGAWHRGDDFGRVNRAIAGLPPLLRPYQRDVINRFKTEVTAGRRRVLMTAPTGSGKTVIAAAIIEGACRDRRRVLVLAHRREIVAQTVEKLYRAGVDAGIIQANFAPRPGVAVQVASVQTLHTRAVRSRSIEPPPADLVVVDEAHHVRTETYRRILAAYPGAIVLGLTATPCRGDGRGLGNVFDVLIEAATPAALVEDGYLVPSRVYAPSRPDLTGVRVERGDYVESQLAERVDTAQLVGDIVEHWHRLAERRRTVVFATGVAHSVHIRDEFRRAEVLAEHLDGSTPIDERDSILARLAAGKIEVVTNAMVLTEGWDSPSVSCLVLARPTKSLGLYRQMVGRALRPASGKTDALILDHAGAVFMHGFPDDPITWRLHEDRRAENAAHAKRGEHGPLSLTECPECRAVRFRGQPCPVCGWRPQPKAAALEIVDGELVAVGGDRVARPVIADFATRRHFYQQLLWIGRERKYKPGWVAYKYKEKFGMWPNDMRILDPVLPDPAVRAWVRSRQIAYAKAARAS